MVASVTPTLGRELQRLGWALPERQRGYAVLTGHPFDLVLSVVDEVAVAEHDELLGTLGHGTLSSIEARRWWKRHTGENMMRLKDLEDYDEVERKYIESLPLEKRLSGLTPEQQLLALSDDVLRGLPEEYVQALPEPARSELLRRRKTRARRAPSKPRRAARR